SLEDYLRVTGMTPEQLAEDMRAQALDLVRKDLALEAVVAAENSEVPDERVEEWVREQAAEADEDVEAAVERLTGDPAALTALQLALAAHEALGIVNHNPDPLHAQA